MVYKAEDYIELINEEIKWCKEHNFNNLSPDYKEGFIKGLEQAKMIINQTLFIR